MYSQERLKFCLTSSTYQSLGEREPFHSHWGTACSSWSVSFKKGDRFSHIKGKIAGDLCLTNSYTYLLATDLSRFITDLFYNRFIQIKMGFLSFNCRTCRAQFLWTFLKLRARIISPWDFKLDLFQGHGLLDCIQKFTLNLAGDVSMWWGFSTWCFIVTEACSRVFLIQLGNKSKIRI